MLGRSRVVPLVGILEGDRPLFRMTLGQIRGGPTEIKWTREMAREGQAYTLELPLALGW